MVKDIVEKYNLLPNSYYKVNDEPYKDFKVGFCEKERKLRVKWKHLVPDGWYGISLGNPVPEVWLDAVDETLDYILSFNPDMKIFQIKIKFGGLRMYLDKISKEAHEEIYLLEYNCFDQKLIY